MNDMNISLKVVGLSLFLGVQCAYGEFSLNFAPQGSGSIVTTSPNSDNGTNPDSGQTPYLNGASLERPEILTDPTTGLDYYHMIVGSLADGFIQESFIAMGYGNYGSTGLGEPSNSASASGGTSVYDSVNTFGNGYDPLDMNKDAAAQSVTSGNGTANPTRVIMRQVTSDGEMMMEFLKDQYANKPRISFMVNAPDMTLLFDVDMRTISYSDAASEPTVTHTMQLWGADTPPDGAAFDMSTYSSATPSYSAGKYTYTNGVGFGGSEGTYTYSDGAGYDPTAEDWSIYYDPFTANPWHFESAKP